jgi:hypothetical protein
VAVLRPPAVDLSMPSSAEQARALAYLRDEGPRPDGPPDGESGLRVECCAPERCRGALRRGEYLPGMSDGERREADELARVVATFHWAPPWLN